MRKKTAGRRVEALDERLRLPREWTGGANPDTKISASDAPESVGPERFAW